MSALEAAKEILDKFGVAHHHWCVSCAEIIDRLAVQPAVAAERKRAEGLVKALRAISKDQIIGNEILDPAATWYRSTACKALADYGSNAPVPTEGGSK